MSTELENQECTVYHAESDADVLIVQKAVESSELRKTVLIGDDTDLLVLLIFYANIEFHDIFFIPQQKSKSSRIWNIKEVKKQLDPDITRHIFFLHSLPDCDTTSRLHGIGKGSSIKKIQTNKQFKEVAEIFDKENASTDEIAASGEKALLIIYNT